MTESWKKRFAVLLCLLLPLGAQAACEGLYLINGILVDGTGSPPRTGGLHVVDGRFRAVGDVAPCAGAEIINVGGLVLAPGFIDTHSHHDRDLLTDPALTAALSQGITTIVVGQDGGSQLPLAGLVAAVEKQQPAINVASYTGHNTLRARVMGQDYRRPANPEEVAAMRALLEADLAAGSLGLSTGLEYDPGIFSSTEEVIALAKTTAKAGGRYISHVRSEDRSLLAALDELIEIGAAAKLPVQASHLKLARVGLWGQAEAVLAKLNAARERAIDVTADLYPYTYWQSTMTVLLPERDFTDLDAARYALEELAPPDGLILTAYEPDPSLVGQSVAEIAARREEPPAETYLALIRAAYPDGGATLGTAASRESVLGRSMDEADIQTLAAWPHLNFCTDGWGGGGHPRGWGAFPRVLRWLGREGRQLSLEAAVHKLSGLGADHVGLPERGRLAVGAPADFVLFDARTVGDEATIEAPATPATGIAGVWVNGQLAYRGGGATGLRAGRFLRRPTKGAASN